MREIVTRFAPSPTGFLHIGGVRTAIYNYLFAKKHQGKYLLRIEDTDRERSTTEAVEAILSGLSWLGLQYDGEAVFQSANKQRHYDAAQELLAKGCAYKCYCTPQELEIMREKARKLGKTALYDGTWRERDDSGIEDGTPYAIRLKVNRTQEFLKINDIIQGEVIVHLEHIDDFVLLRADGSPTYMLSVVVDDHDMNISHVIRGADHHTNSFRQVALYEAFGWEVPTFAHLGLLHGSDGKKLSKRHGSLGVDAYRDMGFLPSALVYYLAGIGWSTIGDAGQNASLDAMAATFTMEKISKSASQFDFEKLASVNAEHMRNLSPADLCVLTWEWVEKRYPEASKDRYSTAIPILVKRSKNLKELVDNASFFLKKPNPTSIKKQLEGHIPTLRKLHAVFESISSDKWLAPLLHECLQNFAREQELSFGKVGKPLRIALTGAAASPGDLTEILVLFQKTETLRRMLFAAQSCS